MVSQAQRQGRDSHQGGGQPPGGGGASYQSRAGEEQSIPDLLSAQCGVAFTTSLVQGSPGLLAPCVGWQDS